VSSAPEFRYTLDGQYLDTANARIVALLPAWRRALVRGIWPILVLAGGGLLSWRYRDQPYYLALALTVFVVAVLYVTIQERRKRRGRFRGTALENAPTHIAFDEQGLEIHVADSHIRVSWAAEVRARAFEDGWLLVESSGDARWLPKSGLSSATPEDVDEWLRARIGDFARAA
jgi:hypothetical protein